MTIKEALELASVEDGTLSEDQIRRIFKYARIMLNIFRLSPNAHDAIKDLEQGLECTNLDFDREGFMVMSTALCFLIKSINGSQFFLTEEYDLTPSHEQGFKSVIDGEAVLRGDAEYISGLAINVYLGHFRSMNLVNFDRQVRLSRQEELIIKTRVGEEMHGDQVVIFTESI